MGVFEEWRPIKGFPNYLVSNLGQVISLSRAGANKSKGVMILKELNRKNGYLKVDLYLDGKGFSKSVHRLVAEAFIPNPDNLPEVNHKDEDKTNNHVNNLEWCTPHDNKVYGSRREKVARKVSDPNIRRRNNTSDRKGVFKTKWNTWKVYFNRKYLGTFKTFDEAVRVREKAEKEAYNF